MNPNALDRIADELTDKNGNIMGITAYAVKHSAFMDNMTYGVASTRLGVSQIDYMFEEASKGTNVFNNGCHCFAPNSVRSRCDFGVSSNEQSSPATPAAHVSLAEEYVDGNDGTQNANDTGFTK